MSSHNLLAWGLTAVSLLVGALVALDSGDWSWFSRSGAAVVAVGIVLTSHQVFEHNRRLLEHQRKNRHLQGPRPYDAHAHDWANENSMRQLIRARSHEEENWRREFSGFHMLVGGTLVWGFGDLVGLLLA
jgi:hypothetical protein